jgi:hypothetical protein
MQSADVGRAQIHSTESLVDLAKALDRFSKKGLEELIGLRRHVDRQRAELLAREKSAREAEQSCAEQLANADEDDADYWSAELDGARQRLRSIRRWRARVEEEYRDFRSAAASLESDLSRSLPRGLAFLRSKIENVAAYHSVQPDPLDREDAVTNALVSEPPSHEARENGTLTSFRLPRGFVWVSLSEIDLARGLEGVQTEADFGKVSYETMTSGLMRLRDEILPRMQTLSRCSSDAFREIDRQNGDMYETGLQRVYEAFFGAHDYLYLERGKSDEKFGVTNGRHRIKVAQDLGWDAVPAQVKDLHA